MQSPIIANGTTFEKARAERRSDKSGCATMLIVALGACLLWAVGNDIGNTKARVTELEKELAVMKARMEAKP